MDSPLTIVRVVLTLALAGLAVWGKRWAYVAFIIVALLYFPMKVGFALDPRPCEWTFGLYLAGVSLTNFPHIILFALFFLLTSRQFDMSKWSSFGWAMLCTIGFGLLLEFMQGISGDGHCRIRDLIPDTFGSLIGAALVLLGRSMWRRFRVKRIGISAPDDQADIDVSSTTDAAV